MISVFDPITFHPTVLNFLAVRDVGEAIGKPSHSHFTQKHMGAALNPSQQSLGKDVVTNLIQGGNNNANSSKHKCFRYGSVIQPKQSQ